MSKQAGPSKARPIDSDRYLSKYSATTQEITIQLQKPNENRGLKAIVGALIIMALRLCSKVLKMRDHV